MINNVIEFFLSKEEKEIVQCLFFENNNKTYLSYAFKIHRDSIYRRKNKLVNKLRECYKIYELVLILREDKNVLKLFNELELKILYYYIKLQSKKTISENLKISNYQIYKNKCRIIKILKENNHNELIDLIENTKKKFYIFRNSEV